MSPDLSVVMASYKAMGMYLRNIHELCRFGKDKGRKSADSVLDSVNIVDKDTTSVEGLFAELYRASTCYLLDSAECKEKPNRLPTTAVDEGVPLFGIELLLQRVLKAVEEISSIGVQGGAPYAVDGGHPSVVMVNTLLREDLRDGLEKLTRQLTEQSVGTIKSLEVWIFVVSAVDLVLIVAVFFYITFHVQSQLDHVAFKTQRIEELVPIEETMAIRWAKAFNLGEQKLDVNHRLLLDSAAQLVDELIKGEDKAVRQAVPNMRQLLHGHLKAEEKIIVAVQHPRGPLLVKRMKEFNAKFDELIRCYDDSLDVTESMSALFNYFIDVHIMEDNKILHEFLKEKRM